MTAAGFDDALAAYQERLAAEVEAARERSFEVAARPDAVPTVVTFADLWPGDYITSEGPDGRWVRVVELQGPCCNVARRTGPGESARSRAFEEEISVLFEIPEPVHVSGETHYWIERPPDAAVTIDASAR